MKARENPQSPPVGVYAMMAGAGTHGVLLLKLSGVYRQIPNLITIARLLLTVVFFALLHINDRENFRQAMWIAFAVFLVAALTDMLDGYLARKWRVESAFGRVVDPFVDKIMICGAFIFFASDDFINVPTRDFLRNAATQSSQIVSQLPTSIHLTGVAPWMVVVLIGREFLITGIRGLAESKGVDFRADWAGKIKMVTQSFAVGAILVDLANGQPVWIQWTRDILIWTTLVVTILSSISYIIRARRIIHD